MFKKKIKKQVSVKPNLIPILDAVFIFIFFLLMSAQFIKIYEIGSDAPAVSIIDPQKKDKNPLNLTLQIKEDEIVITTGIENANIAQLKKIDGKYDLDGLRGHIMKIKQNNIDEQSIVLRPSTAVSYRDLVMIMDTVRKLENDNVMVEGKTEKGELVKTTRLFEQIIFETMI